jgi:hypothetical protein
MNPSSLVDLYVPGNVGPFEEVAEAAARAGLDAVVWVAESPEALPPAAAAAHERGDRAAVHGALVLEGPGYRMLVLAARARLLKFATTAGALGSPADIADAARLAGGVALAVSPRQGAGGAVCREPAALPGSCVAGMVVQVCENTHFGRDLDLEDAGALGRRILGGTGPFGGFDDVGRYASYVPGDARDVEELVALLARGTGVAVEIGGRAPASPAESEPPRASGRRRRRRPRGPREGGGGDA